MPVQRDSITRRATGTMVSVKRTNSDFVANTNMQGNAQRRKGKPPQRGGGMNLERLLNQPCSKHGTKEVPATHLWKDCFIMREFKNSDLFRYDQGPFGKVHGKTLLYLLTTQDARS